MKISKDSHPEFVIWGLNQNIITVLHNALYKMEAQIVLSLETAWEWCCLCYTLDEGKQSVSPVWTESQSNITEDGTPWNSKDFFLIN